jgi:hypothetical protein
LVFRAVKLLEFLDQKDIETAVYDPAQDQTGVRTPADTRKPRLTLRHLNRLKKIRALRKLENLKREDLLGIMYSAPDEGAGGLGAPPGF